MQRSPRRSRRPACATCAPTEESAAARGAWLAWIWALASCTPTAHYDYTHLPSGYRWRAVYDQATNSVVYYGQDRLTRDTVYVGPDGRFFIFRHPGTISERDLSLRWNPHDAP